MTTVLLCLAGGLGAIARFVADAFVNRRVRRSPMPLGTLSINVSGSFLLGVLSGLVAHHAGLSPALAAVLGTGFCGGYTTFSAASLEAVRLWGADGPAQGITYAATTLIGSVAAAGLGLWASALA